MIMSFVRQSEAHQHSHSFKMTFQQQKANNSEAQKYHRRKAERFVRAYHAALQPVFDLRKLDVEAIVKEMQQVDHPMLNRFYTYEEENKVIAALEKLAELELMITDQEEIFHHMHAVMPVDLFKRQYKEALESNLIAAYKQRPYNDTHASAIYHLAEIFLLAQGYKYIPHLQRWHQTSLSTSDLVQLLQQNPFLRSLSFSLKTDPNKRIIAMLPQPSQNSSQLYYYTPATYKAFIMRLLHMPPKQKVDLHDMEPNSVRIHWWEDQP